MNDKANIECSQCKSEVHWLDIFPNNLCLPCHARKHENDTPEQMFADITKAFGGKQ